MYSHIEKPVHNANINSNKDKTIHAPQIVRKGDDDNYIKSQEHQLRVPTLVCYWLTLKCWHADAKRQQSRQQRHVGHNTLTRFSLKSRSGNLIVYILTIIKQQLKLPPPFRIQR